MRQLARLCLILASAVWLAASSAAQTVPLSTNNVVVNVASFGQSPQFVSSVTVQAQYWLVANGSFYPKDPITITRANYMPLTNGVAVFSNLVCNVPYQLTIASGWANYITNFLVPLSPITNSDGSVNAALYSGQYYGSSTPFFAYSSLAGFVFATNYLNFTNAAYVTNFFQITNNLTGTNFVVQSGTNTTIQLTNGYYFVVNVTPGVFDTNGAATLIGTIAAANLLSATNWVNTNQTANFLNGTNAVTTNSAANLLNATNSVFTITAAKLLAATNATTTTTAANLLAATNSVVTSLTTNLLNATNAVTTNLMANLLGATNAVVTNLNANILGATNWVSTNQTANLLNATNSVLSMDAAKLLAATNSVTTSLTANLLNATNGVTTNLTANLLNATNAVTTNLTANLLNATNSVTLGVAANLVGATNWVSTNQTANLLNATNSVTTITASRLLSATNWVSTNQTANLLNATNAVVTNLTANLLNATNWVSTNQTANLLNATNSLAVSVASNLLNATNSVTTSQAVNLLNATNSVLTMTAAKLLSATNWVSTNQTANLLNATNAVITNLTANLLNATNAVTTNLTANLLNATNWVSTNQVVTLLNATNSLNASIHSDINTTNVANLVTTAANLLAATNWVLANDAANLLSGTNWVSTNQTANLLNATNWVSTNQTANLLNATNAVILSTSNSLWNFSNSVATGGTLARNAAVAQVATTASYNISMQPLASTNFVINNSVTKTNGNASNLTLPDNVNLGSSASHTIAVNQTLAVGLTGAGSPGIDGTYLYENSTTMTNTVNSLFTFVYSAPNYYAQSNGSSYYVWSNSMAATGTPISPPAASPAPVLSYGWFQNENGGVHTGIFTSTNLTSQMITIAQQYGAAGAFTNGGGILTGWTTNAIFSTTGTNVSTNLTEIASVGGFAVGQVSNINWSAAGSNSINALAAYQVELGLTNLTGPTNGATLTQVTNVATGVIASTAVGGVVGGVIPTENFSPTGSNTVSSIVSNSYVGGIVTGVVSNQYLSVAGTNGLKTIILNVGSSNWISQVGGIGTNNVFTNAYLNTATANNPTITNTITIVTNGTQQYVNGDNNGNLELSGGLLLGGNNQVVSTNVVSPYTNGLIPIMTSDTAPSGKVSSSSTSGNLGVYDWKAFTGFYSSFFSWYPNNANIASSWIEYQFPSAVQAQTSIGYFSSPTPGGLLTMQLQSSLDNATWNTIISITNIGTGIFYTNNFAPVVAPYFRWLFVSNQWTTPGFFPEAGNIQLYGQSGGVSSVLLTANASGLNVGANINTSNNVTGAGVYSGDIGSSNNIDAKSYTLNGAPLQYLTNTILTLNVVHYIGQQPVWTNIMYWNTNSISGTNYATDYCAGGYNSFSFPSGYWSNSVDSFVIGQGAPGWFGVSFTANGNDAQTYYKYGGAIIGIYPTLAQTSCNIQTNFFLNVTIGSVTNYVQGITTLTATNGVNPAVSGSTGYVPTNFISTSQLPNFVTNTQSGVTLTSGTFTPATGGSFLATGSSWSNTITWFPSNIIIGGTSPWSSLTYSFVSNSGVGTPSKFWSNATTLAYLCYSNPSATRGWWVVSNLTSEFGISQPNAFTTVTPTATIPFPQGTNLTALAGTGTATLNWTTNSNTSTFTGNLNGGLVGGTFSNSAELISEPYGTLAIPEVTRPTNTYTLSGHVSITNGSPWATSTDNVFTALLNLPNAGKGYQFSIPGIANSANQLEIIYISSGSKARVVQLGQGNPSNPIDFTNNYANPVVNAPAKVISDDSLSGFNNGTWVDANGSIWAIGYPSDQGQINIVDTTSGTVFSLAICPPALGQKDSELFSIGSTTTNGSGLPSQFVLSPSAGQGSLIISSNLGVGTLVGFSANGNAGVTTTNYTVAPGSVATLIGLGVNVVTNISTFGIKTQ